MFEFIKSYWQFFVAGIILIALIAYWIVEAHLSKKKKEKEFNDLEKELEKASFEKEEQPNEQTKEDAKEKEGAKAEETVLEEKPKAKKEKKAKVKEEKVLEKTQAEEDKKVEAQPAENKEVVEESQTEKPATKQANGAYMISYDKEKKDWVIKRRGSQRATKRTKTKKEALEIVKKLTETQEVGFIVKKKNGKFQKK